MRILTMLRALFLTLALGCSSGEDGAAPAGAGSGASAGTGAGGSGGDAGGSGGTGGSSGGAGGSSGGTGGSSGGTGGSSSGTGGGSGAGGSASGSGGSGGAVTVRDPLPCFADEGTPAGAAIDLVMTPSRLSGVAPLSVYFDTVGTSAEAARPFHSLAYCWDFGDASAGSFAPTGVSKNQARGPVAAHVFETPGTYTVTLSARDASGRVKSVAVDVTVEDPDVVYAGSSTVCLSDDGDFTGCPGGADQVTGASLSDVSSYVTPGSRILLRRGGTFTGSLTLNVAGPGTIGAFGASENPRPRFNPSSRIFTVSDGEAPQFSDWRIMDLEAVGNPGSVDSELLYAGGKARDLLLLRVSGTGLGHHVRTPISIIEFYIREGFTDNDVIDYLTIQDSDFQGLQGGNGHVLVGVAGHHMALLGNRLRDSTAGEHVMRVFWCDSCVYSNNEFADAPAGRNLLKLHAPLFGSSPIGMGRFTERMVISDNLVRCQGGHDWSIAIGPENDQSDERVRDIIVERNLFLPSAEAQVALILWGVDITVRDNLFNRGPQQTCIAGGQRGIEPQSERITVAHNTCYTEGARPAMAGVSGAMNHEAYNNLLVGPNVVDPGISSSFVGAEGNLGLTDAAFANAELTAVDDFELDPSSPAIDAAVAAHATAWDFKTNPRPVDGDDSGSAEPDVGALEHSP